MSKSRGDHYRIEKERIHSFEDDSKAKQKVREVMTDDAEAY